MFRRFLLLTLVIAVSCNTLFAQTGGGADETTENPFPVRLPVPDGILDGGQGWLNAGGPISMKDLRGKIVVVDFWTYCCINCIHVLPDLKFLEKKYPNEVVVLGVHSAKFTNEKETANIREAIMRYEIEHPVVNDADMTIWRKFQAQSWPTLVIINPEGECVVHNAGEPDRALLDAVIGRLIKFHRANGTLDETPTAFQLERQKAEPTPLRYPGKVLADPEGKRLFVADTGHNRIVVAGMDGTVQATIGSGAIGLKDGDFATAEFDHPQGMALADGVLYVADTENHSIRAVDLEAKTVTTIAGTGKQARRRFPGGPAKTTPLNSPWALQHLDGILFIAMAGPHQLWQHVIGSDEVSVFAGSGREDVTNGTLNASALAQPSGLASDGNVLFVADSEGSAIRQIGTSSDSEVTTLAGPSNMARGRALFEFGDLDGTGATARMQHPLGVAYNAGTVYVADSYNHKIRALDVKSQKLTTFVGSGKPGKAMSPPQLSEPGGLSVTEETLFIADTNNHRLCAVTLADKSIRVVELKGLAPPKPAKRSSFGPVKPIALEAKQVAPGKEIEVAITFDIPEGYKLNKQMPIMWTAENAGTPELLAVAAGSKPTRAKPDDSGIRFKLPLKDGATAGQIQVSVRYGFCRDGVGGLCKIATRSWRIPVTIDEGGQKTLAIP